MFNNPNMNFGNFGYQNVFQPQVAPSIKTNKIFVTSLDDAMARFAEPNTEIIYWHQDQPLIFEIKTDGQGRKGYRTFRLENLTLATQEQAKKEYVTHDQLKELQDKVEDLQKKLGGTINEQ